MGALQPLHLVVILAIVLVIFGAGRLGEVGSALGKGMKDFRSSVEKEPATTGATRFCTQCGSSAALEARFCPKCGAALPS